MMFTQMLREKRFLAVAVLISFFVLVSRFYLLAEIPTAVSHDEMIYAVNAQSVAWTGTDITGTWNPFSLTPMHPNFAELPTLLQAPFFYLPVEPVIAARLPFVIMSLLIPFILAGISYELFRSKLSATLTGILSAFNPWIWQFGRMGFDSYWSLFFFSIGAYLLLRLQKWAKLWSLLPLFFGFYQYQGYKLGFLPWIGMFVVFVVAQAIQIQQKKNAWKISIQWPELRAPFLVFLLSVLLFLFYVFVQLPKQGSSERVATMLMPNNSEIVEKVNDRRKLSLASPVSPIITNKYVVWGEEIFRRYTEVYSPKHLFLTSQYSGFNVWSHGLFYALDAVLLAVGVFSIWKKKSGWMVVLLVFGLGTTVVSAVLGEGNSFLFRPSLSIPLLLLITGAGASYLLQQMPKLVAGGATVIYVGSIMFFATQYFIRYPVYSAESNYFTDKVLSTYVSHASQNEIVIYTNEPEFTYTALVFYNDLFKNGNVGEIQQSYKNQSFHIQNLRLTDECVPVGRVFPPDVTSIVRHSAKICDSEFLAEEVTPVVLEEVPFPRKFGAVKDSGTVYTVYQDKVCEGVQLPTHVHITSMRAFDMEHLSREEFCSTWLMN